MGSQIINPVSFRKNIAYVMQDDALMATATPRETLRFSARLRLDPSIPDAEIEKRVTDMLAQLGLNECADTYVGGQMIKGISGGQRKRTSVGVEVITEPTLLFLDEPTSGLDSYSACALVELLKKVGNKNTAVLCTIHQPSSEVFHMFDKVIFMKEGRIFYQGTVENMNQHFAKLGHACPSGHNPADHVMSLSQRLTHKECLEQNLYMEKPSSSVEVGNFAETVYEPPIMAGIGLQLRCLMYREWQSIIRNKGALIARFGITIFLNVLFGVIFWESGAGDSADSVAFQGHFGSLTMITISSMFGSAQPVMLNFPYERPMFMREYSTGTYGALTYFVTKTLLDAPLTFLTCVVQYAVAYPMLKLQGNFIYLVLSAFGLGIASASCGMALGCAVPDVKQVTEFAPVLFVPQLLFAGFFVATERIPLILRWAQWLCAIKYTMNLIITIEFAPDNETCLTSPGAAINCARCLLTNSVVESDYWKYILCLAALFLGFRIIAAMILIQKSKRFY